MPHPLKCPPALSVRQTYERLGPLTADEIEMLSYRSEGGRRRYLSTVYGRFAGDYAMEILKKALGSETAS